MLQNAESDAAKAFLEVAAQNDALAFGITSHNDLFKEHKVDKDEQVVLFKKVGPSNVNYPHKKKKILEIVQKPGYNLHKIVRVW